MQKEISEFHFDQFKDLDISANLEYLMSSMELMASLPCIKYIKEQAISSMQLSPGDTVLEAGCGLGVDALRISKIVGDSGQVIALDASENMLEEANKRSPAPNIQYQHSRIEQLEYPSNHFDACHMERVLVDYDNATDIITELLRVIKPGGKICITDVDPLSIALTPHNETTTKVLLELYKCFVNPDMGRKLPTLVNTENVTDLKIFANTSTIRDYTYLDQLFQFENILDTAIRNGSLEKVDAMAWLRSAKSADKKGDFFYSIMLFTVIATKC